MSDDGAAAPTVLLEIREQVARITLNRPAAGNALSLDLARDLLGAAQRCSADTSVRVVLITGAGANFCVGGDLKSFSAQGEHMGGHIKQVLEHLHPAIALLSGLEAPVIAAVNGAAAGAGMSLACACDLVLAGESARFTLAYTRVGLSPDGSATYFLPRLVGLRRALDLALTNRTLTANEARDWGIVSSVVPDAELLVAAERLAERLANGATAAFGATRRLFRASMAHSLEEQMAQELDQIVALATQPDAQEGAAAFVAKRTPHFTGR
ncbi:MAG TPA: enoyl-CoA hydratase-related protein [Ktedonobacterales bacterium]|nr:enoyl-CoA hydratase-related protein [Ktedonobacterales bacterium]